MNRRLGAVERDAPQVESATLDQPGDDQPLGSQWRRLGSLVRREKVLVAWLVIGLVGRGVLVHSAWGSTNSDEAVGMLMASRAAHGQFFSLFWGGNYGGTLVTVVDGLFVRVFGLRILDFRIVDIAILVVATVLVRLVAGRLVSAPTATAAAVLFWVAPPDWVRFSQLEYVWWVPGMCLSLGVALCCLRWNERRTDRRLWPIGLLAGAAFWLYLPLMVLAASPVLGVAWVLRRRPGGLIRLVALVPLGASPWLYTTFAHHFGT
ncbi:MAG: hypothetical protein M3Y91_18715, partial [Actinomycetota bacterium]|nr:hypothetical protein [Actinomycetota bacterium]